MRIQAPLPQGLSQDKDVQFAAPDGVELCMDIYRPDDGQTYPLVVAIHAGGMRCCTRAELGDESKQLALSGYVVINVDYRYYPYHFPTAWTDVVSAIDYMREHATEYRVDVDNIGLLGSSAGGTITGWGISHPVPGLKAGVSWSGAFDLRPFDQVAIDGRPGAVAHVLLFFGCYGCPEVTKFASVLAVSSDTLPLRLFNSENEIQPLLEATAMRDALEEAGVPHELTVFPGTRHASAYADDALGPTIEWLDQYLK
jgi:acetyl esterase/lipase